ncbi:MAG: permease [Bacilli bacterium]
MELIQNIWEWLMNNILKMKWLEDGMGLLVTDVFHLSLEERIGQTIHFFLYDTIKIFILLMVFIGIVSYIQSYFPPERTKNILGKMKGIKGNIIGALLGTLTPFCSCSSIPIFIGFTVAGLPLGVTFSFLISSPLVDLASFMMLGTFFGFDIALYYVVVGLVLAVVGGSIIDKLHMESQIQDFVLELRSDGIESSKEEIKLTKRQRAIQAIREAFLILKRVYLYVLIGVGIGALIHNWIPTSFITTVLGEDNPFSVFIAAFISIPMYADIFGTLPIAEALLYKGVEMGTILTFMMGVTALSLPSLVLLHKVVKKKLLFVFIGIVTIGIIIIGYLFNFII